MENEKFTCHRNMTCGWMASGLYLPTYALPQKPGYTPFTCLTQDRLPGAPESRGAGFGIRRVAVTLPSCGDVLPGAVVLVDLNIAQQYGEPGLMERTAPRYLINGCKSGGGPSFPSAASRSVVRDVLLNIINCGSLHVPRS